MTIKHIFETYTPEEIADAMVLPVTLTVKQQKEADRQLAEQRIINRAKTTDEERIYFKLMQLKFRLEDYIKNGQYHPEFTFGYFLEQYLEIINKKKKEFAREIQIHETLLSNILKNRREPNYNIMIRLELHSDNIIPAVYWLKILEKEKEHQINTDYSLRERESKYVTHGLPHLV